MKKTKEYKMYMPNHVKQQSWKEILNVDNINICVVRLWMSCFFL